MLHEILLSLSGHPSPIWKQIDAPETKQGDDNLREYISPPEREMLQVLGNLSNLHIQIEGLAKKISSSHPSLVCRAVAGSISSEQLGNFRQKVIEVEASVLSKDATYVGGYDIVPLSTIVGEFAPWTRRLEWLWEVVRFIGPSGGDPKGEKAACTGARLIDFLQHETYTGYSDLEEMATTLLATAEKSWMRNVAAWMLYGRILDQSKHDFFVEKSDNSSKASTSHTISWDLVPKLISPTIAESVLYVGNTLNHIRHHLHALPVQGSDIYSDISMDLLPQHLSYLKSLDYPLSSASLASAVTSIQLSISQKALSQLLPLPRIIDIMEVIREFLLLGRGEFAMSLISQADKRIANRSKTPSSIEPVRKVGRLDDLKIQAVEATGVLNEAWSDLAILQSEDESQDRCFDNARQLLRLEVLRSDRSKLISTIFPSPAILTLSLPSDSSLSLFLKAPDIETYATVTSYLLSIRRAEIHLNNLWKITPLRRCNPTPLGPPLSASRAGQRSLATRRARDDARNTRTRKHWACAGKVLFVFNELGGYLHGEVIARHWKELETWIRGTRGERPGSAGSGLTTSQSSVSASRSREWGRDVRQENTSDPATLAEAHGVYLQAMRTALFLGDEGFLGQLKELLMLVDHFIALFSRLQIAWQGVDLQEDEGVVDALTNYKKDEGEVLWEMDRSGKALDEKVDGLVERIKGFASADLGTGLEGKMEEIGIGGVEKRGGSFVPFKGRVIDRLIMKLELLTGGRARNGGDDEGRHVDDD